jgi:predicted type IV restriction endonuclease
MHDPARRKTGLWKRRKNKLRFSTVPTAPTAADKSTQAAADPKQTDDRLHKTFDATSTEGVNSFV